MPPLSGEKWDQYFEKMIRLVLDSNKDKIDPSDVSGFNEHLGTLSEFLEPVLDTPRKIKSMCRHLDEKLKTPASTIYFVDLVFLSAIQTFNPKLFQWISTNKKVLVDPSSATHERWATLSRASQMMDRLSQGELNRGDVAKTKLKEFGATEYEIEIVFQLFFGSNNQDNSTSEPEVNESSVRKNNYFLTYFSRDRLPVLGTVAGKKNLFSLIQSDSKSIDDIYDFIKEDWVQYDQRPDLREIILGNIRKWILDLPQEQSYRLMIALGKLSWLISDEGFIFRPKTYAAFSGWDFIENKTTNQDEYFGFIIRIINENISHKFYTSIIFYLFTQDSKRNKNRYKDALDLVDKVRDSFNNRCKELLYLDYTNGKVWDIFNADVSDAPFDLLYRWAQVQSSRSQEAYLIQLVAQHPETIKKIVDYLKGQPQEGIEVVLSRAHWKSILENRVKFPELSDKDFEFIASVVEAKHQTGWES
jgi:hypothetical protein